jgi:single-strand DNA-binding protein
MSAIKNKVQLVGNLGSDPIVKTFESGRKLAQFRLATNEKLKNKAGDRVEETQWHNIIIWGKLATIAERYLIKGSEVIIEGKLSYRKYEGKEGVSKFISEVVCNELLLIDKKATA